MEQTGVAAKLQPDEELSGLWKDLAIKGFAGPNATWTVFCIVMEQYVSNTW